MNVLTALRGAALDPSSRRRLAIRFLERSRGRLSGHPGVRIGTRCKLMGHGQYDLQPGSRIHSGVRIFVAAGATLTLAPGSSIGDRCVVNVSTGVSIGRGSQISWQCQILDTDFHTIYGPDGVAKPTALPIEIGENVLIGTGVLILKGVTIGRSAVVGAGSVVVSSVAAATVVGGNPARRLGLVTGWK